LAARAFAAVRASGRVPNEALRKSFLDGMLARRPSLLGGLPVMVAGGGDFDSLLLMAMAYADLGETANPITDAIVHYLAGRQHPSGAWAYTDLSRPPMQDSFITRTAMAVRALAVYGWPARQPEFAERIARARAWLQTARPANNYERADRINGLYAAGVPKAELLSAGDALVKEQKEDGGWSQTPYLESDAYATGMVLHTLKSAGLLAPTDAAYQRGVTFLRRTQLADGSWHVSSRSPKFQPYFQSGFPHDHDQWISFPATAWAVMALAPVAAP
jgi:hypothetical protein